MRRCLATPVVLALLLLTALVAAAQAAPRRDHGTHGTVRRVCEDALVKRWPGGPVVGKVAKGRDMRRYAFRGHWALGVSHGVPHVYGYMQTERFCPPSAAGRRALARDRLPSTLSVARSGQALPHALARRVCSPHVWLRDRPLDRAIGILWLGDVFVAGRSARNPWFGGQGQGHERRRGWVPRSSLCGRLAKQPAGFRSVPHESGARLLTSPAQLPCATAQPRRGLIEVGVDFTRRRGVPVRADLVVAGHVRRGPIFRPGEAPALHRGAVGPFACGRVAEVVYTTVGAGARVLQRTAVQIEARRTRTAGAARGAETAGAAGAAAAVSLVAAPLSPGGLVAHSAAEPTSATARAPGTACSAKPTLRFAHGHEGPVSHRYDARPALSANGSAIAFDTPLRLTRADRDEARDGYLRSAGSVRLISPGTRTSRAPAISADGRVVAFESDEPGPDDANGERDVFVAGTTGATRLVSRAADGGAAGDGRSRAPSLSADGRLLAFESTAHDLVAGGAPPPPRQGIYLEDLSTGATRLVVANAYRPALSGDGQTLVFETSHAYVASDRNRTVDVYALALRAGGVPVLVSRASRNAAGNGRSVAGSVSADGRFVAFMSAASNLVRGDGNRLRDVFRRDLRERRTVLVSRDRCGGFANGYSRYPSISASGRFVAFDSHAADIVARSTRGEGEVYVRDVRRGRTRIMSTRPDGRPSTRTAFSPALSSDGRVVAFPAYGFDLVAGDHNHRVDQFSRRVLGGRVHRVS
jgi:Tol biopolymer transport system component